MATYIIQAAARMEAANDEEAQSKLDSIAKVLANGDGAYGYDWWLDAGRELSGGRLQPDPPTASS